MPNHRAKSRLTLALDQSGAVAIIGAAVLLGLCGFVALAADIGHLFMVKAELQRTADAGALAGVTGLLPYTGSVPQTPNWAEGVATAHNMISKAANQADNLIFSDTDGTVDYGYWLFNPPTDYVQPPTTGLPKARPTTDAYLPEPAISVTLSRDVTLYFAPLIGVSSPKRVSATAIAMLPENYHITGIPPVAVSWDTVYNLVGGTVQIDLAEQDIKIQSNKGVAGWFNLNGGNSVGSVSNNQFIAESTGTGATPIYLVPGTKATLTDFITVGATIVVPIIQDVSQKIWQPIIGWGEFKVDSLGSNSMTGHFVSIYYSPNASPDERPDPTTLFISGTPKLVGP